MKKLTYLFLILGFILSCSSSKEVNDIFRQRDLGNDQLSKFEQIPPYTSKLKTFENKSLYVFVYDIDTLVLYKSLAYYRPMFTSGLITPRHFCCVPGETKTIEKITELTDPAKALKIRRYRIDYTTTFWRKGQIVREMNPSWAMLELTSKCAYKNSNFNDYIEDSKITFLINQFDI